MNTKTQTALAVGDCLPDLFLASANQGEEIPIRRQGRLASVIVLLHGADCPGCRAYLQDLANAYDSLREWDGRVIPIVPETLDVAKQLRSDLDVPFTILADPQGEGASGCGIDEAAVLIADQWGEIYDVVVAGKQHLFPEPGEVSEWLKYLAIQCPECEGEAW